MSIATTSSNLNALQVTDYDYDQQQSVETGAAAQGDFEGVTIHPVLGDPQLKDLRAIRSPSFLRSSGDEKPLRNSSVKSTSVEQAKKNQNIRQNLLQRLWSKFGSFISSFNFSLKKTQQSNPSNTTVAPMGDRPDDIVIIKSEVAGEPSTHDTAVSEKDDVDIHKTPAEKDIFTPAKKEIQDQLQSRSKELQNITDEDSEYDHEGDRSNELTKLHSQLLTELTHIKEFLWTTDSYNQGTRENLLYAEKALEDVTTSFNAPEPDDSNSSLLHDPQDLMVLVASKMQAALQKMNAALEQAQQTTSTHQQPRVGPKENQVNKSTFSTTSQDSHLAVEPSDVQEKATQATSTRAMTLVNALEKNQQDLLENEGLAVHVTTTPVLVAGMVYGNTIVDAPTVTVHSFINASPDIVMMILRNGHKFATNCTYTLNKTAPIDHNTTTNQENYKIKAPFIGDLSMDLKRTFTTLDHNEGYTMEWNSEKVNIGIQETSGSVQVVPYHGGTLVCCKLSVTPTAMAAATMNTAGITPETLPEKVLGTVQRINDQIKDFV